VGFEVLEFINEEVSITKESCMCTAVWIKEGYFGRNLDYEVGFGERIVITPRNFSFQFADGNSVKSHFAIIGMGVVVDGYPLYFDGINEEGLGMAGLRFFKNAMYFPSKDGLKNIPSFELIPRVLSCCKDTYEAEELLKNANITDKAFSEDMPPAPLHWMLSDKKRTIVAEQTKHGLFIYENPMGVLTNNPTFNVQMERLSGYMQSSSDEPENRFSKNYEIIPDSRGMGGIGLPGDWSSGSRFIKACFIRENSVLQGGEEDNVNHFFHILYSVFHQRGCVRVNGKYEITRYSSCCNLNKGIYYYTTYDDSTIKGVDMMKENLDGCRILEYNLQSDGIKMQN